MDDDIVRSLLDALGQSPDNVALRIAVIRALHERKDPRASTYVDGIDRAKLAATDRAYIAMLLVGSGEPARALGYLDGGQPELLLVRARALHALRDQAGALAAYEAAVRANPTLIAISASSSRHR